MVYLPLFLVPSEGALRTADTSSHSPTFQRGKRLFFPSSTMLPPPLQWRSWSWLHAALHTDKWHEGMHAAIFSHTDLTPYISQTGSISVLPSAHPVRLLPRTAPSLYILQNGHSPVSFSERQRDSTCKAA